MAKTLKELELEYPGWCFEGNRVALGALAAAKLEDEARIEELEEALTSIEEISNECDQQRTASERCYEIRTYARAALKGGQP